MSKNKMQKYKSNQKVVILWILFKNKQTKPQTKLKQSYSVLYSNNGYFLARNELLYRIAKERLIKGYNNPPSFCYLLNSAQESSNQ